MTALGLLALAGCAERMPTQVIVRVEADEATRMRASTVTVRVWGRASAFGSAEEERLARTLDVSGSAADAAFPLAIPLVPDQGDATRRFVVLVTAADAGGAVFVSRRVRSGYVRDRRTVIRVTLELACHDVPDCDAAHTCIAGRCEPACVEPSAEGAPGDSAPIACTDVPDAGGETDAGPADTGLPDAGPPDAGGGPDAAPECVVAGDCACATAWCEGGACAPATEVRVGAITTGAQHTCAIFTDSSRACTGANNSLRLGLGIGTTTLTTMTRPRPAEAGYLELSGGSDFTCGIRTDGDLVCFGRNTYGQLGNGDPAVTEAGTPAPIALATPATGWAHVSAGGSHTCALDGAGSLYCWGRNHAGQLGMGSADTVPHADPMPVPGARRWIAVSLGGAHSCAIAEDGSLWCWGSNASGRLGIDSTVSQATPTLVGAAGDRWTRVRAGGAHTCGIRGGGALFCWGSGTFAQLGDGTTENRLTPQRVGTRSDWFDVAVGNQHTCGLAGEGELLCWGQNGQCQLGLPRATSSAPMPESIEGRTDWLAIASGSAHTCGIDGGGALRCWGLHSSGQAGAGPPPPDEICGARLLCMPAP